MGGLGSGACVPTIAILPFDNPSGDPDQGYFARGFVEDLATELSRFPTLEVVHPRSSARLAPASASAHGLPTVLSDGYLLCGTVRRMGEITRVAAQLIEAASSRQVWAERFDAPAVELFAVQDRDRRPRRQHAREQHRQRAAPAGSSQASDEPRGLRLLAARARLPPSRHRRGRRRRRGRSSSAPSSSMRTLRAPTRVSPFRTSTSGAARRGSCGTRRSGSPSTTRDGRPISTAAMRLAELVLGRILAYRRQFDEAARHVDRAVELESERCRCPRARGPVPYLSGRFPVGEPPGHQGHATPSHAPRLVSGLRGVSPLLPRAVRGERGARVEGAARIRRSPGLARGLACPAGRPRPRRLLSRDVPVGLRGEDHVRPVRPSLESRSGGSST